MCVYFYVLNGGDVKEAEVESETETAMGVLEREEDSAEERERALVTIGSAPITSDAIVLFELALVDNVLPLLKKNPTNKLSPNIHIKKNGLLQLKTTK